MKKIILLLTASLMVLSLAACGGKGNETKATDAPATQAQQGGSETSDKGFTFTTNGVEIYMDEDAAPVIEGLGEYKDYTESSSCAFEGMDKSYFYGSYYVLTGSLSGREFISGLYFVDDTVETDEGLCIGDSKDKVEQLYGTDGFNGSNAYVMDKGPSKLTIILEGDEVSGITYTVIK